MYSWWRSAACSRHVFTVAPLVFVLELLFRESLPLSPARWEDSRRQAGRGEGQPSPLDTLGDSPPRAASVCCSSPQGWPNSSKGAQHAVTNRWTDANSQTCSGCPAETPEWKHGGVGRWGRGLFIFLWVSSRISTCTTVCSAWQTPSDQMLFFFFLCRMGHLLSPKAFVWSRCTLRVNEGGGEMRYLTLFLVFVTTFTGRTKGNHVSLSPLLIFKS